jgi:hypothetical protein
LPRVTLVVDVSPDDLAPDELPLDALLPLEPLEQPAAATVRPAAIATAANAVCLLERSLTMGHPLIVEVVD